jgi:uncharacterized protein DUF3551
MHQIDSSSFTKLLSFSQCCFPHRQRNGEKIRIPGTSIAAGCSFSGWDRQPRSILMRTLIASSGIVGALLLASTAMAQTPNQNAQFCLKSSAMAQPNCIYQTMAQCEQAKGSMASAECIPSSQAGTTGSGGSARTPMSPPPAQSPSPNR